MAKTKYGYAESSALAATNGDGHMYSVVDNENELENGMIVKLGDLIDRENHEISTPADTDGVVLILDVIVPYDQSTTMAGYEVFYNFAKGKSVRAYNIIAHDRYAIVDYMVTSTVAGSDKPAVKGNYLVTDGNRKYKELASSEDVSGYGFVAKIADVIYKSGMTLYLIEVIKNA